MHVESLPALAFDVSEYPLPVWPEPGEEESPAERPSAVDGNVQLVDVAEEAGISFQYFNSTTRDLWARPHHDSSGRWPGRN